MELTTNSQLDLTLNKEDLIDILVDQQLTKLEEQKAELSEKLQKKTDAYNAKCKVVKEKFDKTLIKKYFPFDHSFVKDIRYYPDSASTTITFDCDDYEVRVNNKNTCNHVVNLKEYKDFVKQYKEEKFLLENDISLLTKQIEEITKSPRRIKAKLLTSFLNSSKQGQEVLKVIGSSGKKY